MFDANRILRTKNKSRLNCRKKKHGKSDTKTRSTRKTAPDDMVGAIFLLGSDVVAHPYKWPGQIGVRGSFMSSTHESHGLPDRILCLRAPL